MVRLSNGILFSWYNASFGLMMYEFTSHTGTQWKVNHQRLNEENSTKRVKPRVCKPNSVQRHRRRCNHFSCSALTSGIQRPTRPAANPMVRVEPERTPHLLKHHAMAMFKSAELTRSCSE